jgi:ABC-2 type transport system permease protein
MFSSMVKKEFLLVLRDKQALMALFIMPAIFILIMSVAMKDIFSAKSVSYDIALIDADNSKLSKELVLKISQNQFFKSTSTDDAQVIITIPKGYGDDEANALKVVLDIKDTIKTNEIELFKAKLLNDLVSQRLNTIKTRMAEFSDEASAAIGAVSLSSEQLFSVSYNDQKELPNATQQSVPTWIVFGMFFVIIPMSTIYINEMKQNTLARLSSMNISVFSMSISKTVPYLIIAQIQTWIMLGVGIYLVPLFDTPALEINGSVCAVTLLSFSLSLSAIGLAMLIAVNAKTSEQATTIGGISNILLGAIGGVMVPKFIMPETMQTLANISPMSWGLDGFLDIFLKAGGVAEVLNESLMLMAFGIITLMISVTILQKRINDGL